MRRIGCVADIFALLRSGGSETYFGEPVTVLEHSLQAAWFVLRKGADDTLVAAALLHDMGHLLHDQGEDATSRGLNTQHEELGVKALRNHFSNAVLDPIQLHVAAKRYLCFAEPRYRAVLSPASVQSMALQGGPMTAGEAEAFLASPHAREALTLRRADDAAKVEGLEVPQLETYRPLIGSLWY